VVGAEAAGADAGAVAAGVAAGTDAATLGLAALGEAPLELQAANASEAEASSARIRAGRHLSCCKAFSFLVDRGAIADSDTPRDRDSPHLNSPRLREGACIAAVRLTIVSPLARHVHSPARDRILLLPRKRNPDEAHVRPVDVVENYEQ